MDVHRCRFIPHPPSAINALAFSHPSSTTAPAKGPPNLRLAIGRANGDIEIWNPLMGAWYQESIFRGGKERSVEGLAWTQDPEDVDKHGYKTPGKLRLFSIGYSTAVTEWDLALGKPARHSAGNYGEIWCMAVQPRASSPDKPLPGQTTQIHERKEPQAQSIAVGCADGAIVLLSTAEDDLRFTRTLARPSKKRARVLNLTFQNRNIVIAGHADSTIRIYDVRNGQMLRNMTLGAGRKGGPKETLVWSVKCLSDGTIVSGDSTGTVSFWDGKNHTLVQRIKSHDADILDVAVSVDGRSVFSGGMDRKTISYRRASGGGAGEKIRWAKIAHSRLHQHDVKAMATFESKGLSVLASGGLDTNPIIVPISEFGREHHRTLSSLPQQPSLLSAPKRRLVVSWWDREISIWTIHRCQGKELERERSTDLANAHGRRLVAKIALQGEESITSAEISTDGALLVVSTTAEIKAFQLQPKDGRTKVKKINLPAATSKTGAKLVHLSPDRRWLSVVRADNNIEVYRLVGNEDPKKPPEILQNGIQLKRLHRNPMQPKYQHGTLGKYDRSISRIAFSSDSRILAVGDLSGYLDTWVLEGHEDLTQETDDEVVKVDASSSSGDDDSDDEAHPTVLFGQHWIRNPAAPSIPKLPAAPLILTFRPSVPSKTPLLTNGITPLHATRHNPHPHSHNLPEGEDRLLILTAENQMFEFNVLAGRLSDWSRRNPASNLPQEFRDLRDRAKGAVWDIGRQQERVWLYGVNWLWMFDLSRDLPLLGEQKTSSPSNQAVTVTNGPGELKRKREAEEIEDSHRTRDTGAGSKISRSKLSVGIGREMQKIDGDAEESRWVNLERVPEAPSDEDEAEEYRAYGDISASESALVNLRRDAGGKSQIGEEDEMAAAGQTSSNDETQVAAKTTMTSRPQYWFTYKYRPILGIVPLCGDSDDDDALEEGINGADDEVPRGIEVALLERPLWDVDLPPKYHGDQEWDP